jgi:prepilin-type N-terminal cleavage/methylation domain-containing protein
MILNKKGFTLIELMIVVAIIGILASIAIPNYLLYSAKSRQVEAKTNLGAIYMSQMAYRAEYDIYAAVLGSLDWAPAGSTKYAYGIIAATANAFSAEASGNIDADASIDVWIIDQSKTLTNTANDASS